MQPGAFESVTQQESTRQIEFMKIEGKISYQDLEGGFWGIIDTDGKRYVPVERLPDHVRIDGMRIRADLEPVHMVGTAMWGEHVKVASITTVD